MSAVLNKLQAKYGASSNAEIFRKAIAFLDLATPDNADEPIVIKKSDGQEIQVLMK